jgi:hypothetical protein
MAIIDEAAKEVVCKIVYHGTGRSGKTTNLLYMNHHLPEEQRGRFVTLETPTERTLFFDFLPVKTEARGYRFRYLLYATPGQEYYDASRRLVLKGADAIVFVVDSQAERAQDNWDALELLKKNLTALGQDPALIPMVIQYNKRDLPSAMKLEEGERRYNERRLMSFPAVARNGQGVYETFLTAAKMALTRLSVPAGEARMGALFRSLVVTEDDRSRLEKQLDRLVYESGAAGALLIDESTGAIAQKGTAPAGDHEALGALLACNFTAAQELATLLSGASFSGIMQKGKRWALRTARIDARRFVVLVCGRHTDRARMRNAVKFFRTPIGEYLKQVDQLSPNRMANFGELFSSVTDIAVAGLKQA